MTSKPIFDIENTTYKLSIQLSLNGFSFCIIDSSGQIITTETNLSNDKLLTEQELKIQIANAIKNKPELQIQFTSVEVIYSNDLYCFVPNEYYNPENKALYFKYTIKTLATDFISEEKLSIAPIINLFIPYINVNNYLLEHFKEFNFQHSAGLLVNYLLQKETLETDSKMHLYFHPQHFDIIITKGKRLQLCNTYMYQSNEDVLYYVLFVIEQLELSTETIEVKLLNTCSNELFQLLYTYIRNVTKSTSENNTLFHRLALNV